MRTGRLLKVFVVQFEVLRSYLLGKNQAEEDFPFGPGTLVFRVMGKMFALVGLENNPLRINLKTDPDTALFLREAFPAVQPGYHMNKKHWNTVILDDSLPAEEVFRMIDDSYDLVVKGLKGAEKRALQNFSGS